MAVNPNNAIMVDASDLERIAEVLKDFPEEAGKVTAQVLWDLREQARTVLAQEIPKVYAISGKMVRGAITKERKRFVRTGYNTVTNEVSIEVVGERIKVARFQHGPQKPPTPTKGPKKTKVVSRVTIIRSRGVRVFNPWMGADGKPKNVFLLSTKTQKEGGIKYIFGRRMGTPRKSKENLETVWALEGPAIPQMMKHPKVEPAIQFQMLQRMDKQVNRRLENMVVHMATKVGK